MKAKYDWLNKKTPRSVDLLKLWPENPRLNPEENHISLSDFAEDFTAENADKTAFFELIKSISEDGFIPADPIVVWQNTENEKYYVAEGNRRVLALKLLRDPKRAPKSIRAFVRKHAEKLNKAETEKILVNVAPNFEAAEWYINQRNSSSSLQRPWSRIQQQRWIFELYEKHNGDIDIITSVTKLSQSELESFIRILKIKDLVQEETVKALLSDEEFEKISSYKFPVTIIERFFSNPELREEWGLDYDGTNLVIKSNKESFLTAYAELVKRIIDKDAEIKIDTRTITTNFEAIVSSLPKVSFENPASTSEINTDNETQPSSSQDDAVPTPEAAPPTPPMVLKNNPYRTRLILDIYEINTSSYRLQGLFNELKYIPIKWNNSVAASIRIFLDLSILNYLESEDLINEICRLNPKKDGIININLSLRLEFLKSKLSNKSQGIINKILNHSNELSLDVLNGYVHSEKTHYLNNQFLNNFWDLLFPLFEELLDIKENA